MKKAFIFLMFCAASAIPAAAQARATGFFGAGFSQALNPIGTRLDTGWNVSGGVGVSGRYAGIMVDMMYTDFGLNRDTAFLLGADHGRQQFWALTLDPVLHLNARGPVDFYITGGGGLYSQMFDLHNHGGFHGHFSDTLYKAGVDGGAGFSYRLGEGRIRLFTEARYHHMFTPGSGSSFIPVTIGVSF